MDFTKPIRYRGNDLNSAILGTGRVLRGVSTESADYSLVGATGYTEKRAGADGLHASDVYLDGRTIEMRGFVYATSLGEMFDYLHVMRATFSPTSAYQESPGDRGFLPLEYNQPTLDVQSFPVATYPNGIPLYILARPMENLRFDVNRDRQSRNGQGPAATPWSGRLLAKDPRVYISPGQVVDMAGAVIVGGTGDAINRGDYETPLNIQLIVNTPPATDQTFRVKGFNNIDMTITIKHFAPDGTTVMPKTAYRWFGDDRVLMTENISAGIGTGSLVLRMDLVKFATQNRRPLVPAAINPPSKPFKTTFTYWRSMALDAGSRLFWSEAFA